MFFKSKMFSYSLILNFDFWISSCSFMSLLTGHRGSDFSPECYRQTLKLFYML